MSFNITFDYRFDSNGFFDDPARRAALEAAGSLWEGIIRDEFEDVPAGIAFTVDDPSQAGTSRKVVLETPIDDLLIFVGAEALAGPAGVGGYDGTDAKGDMFNIRTDGNFRGTGPVTDFEPYVGTVAFDLDANWNFALEGPQPGKVDFIGVALHEIGHVLGVGTAPAFDALVSDGAFDGPNARAANGGDPIPLDPGLSHVEDGFAGDSVLMDPSQTNGTRSLPGALDLAILADIGYEIDGLVPQGTTPPIATAGDDRTIFGTVIADVLDGLAGNDQIQGAAGDDSLLGGDGADTLMGDEGGDTLRGGAGDDQLQGGAGQDLLDGGSGVNLLFGQDGTDSFLVSAGGGLSRVIDFDLADEVIVLMDSGFGSVSEAVAALGKPFSNVSRLTFSDGTMLDVFHASQSGSPLEERHFRIETSPAPVIEGDDGRDRLTGGADAETFLGGGGNDVLIGGGGADTMTGGAGHDTFVLRPRSPQEAVTLTDFGDGDRLALDDRFFGLGDAGIDVRAVTKSQAQAALHAGKVVFDKADGALWIDGDGAGRGADPDLVAVLEGGAGFTYADVVLF